MIAPFAFAGLWEWCKGTDGPLESCTIVTTEPNELMRPPHNRMPVILPDDAYDQWLDPKNEDTESLTLKARRMRRSTLFTESVSRDEPPPRCSFSETR